MPATGSTRREDLIRIGPTLLGELLEAAPHRLQAALDRTRGCVVERDAPAGGRQHLSDAAAHLACADYEHVVEGHEARG